MSARRSLTGRFWSQSRCPSNDRRTVTDPRRTRHRTERAHGGARA